MDEQERCTCVDTLRGTDTFGCEIHDDTAAHPAAASSSGPGGK